MTSTKPKQREINLRNISKKKLIMENTTSLVLKDIDSVWEAVDWLLFLSSSLVMEAGCTVRQGK
jgi:hypothetical protein